MVIAPSLQVPLRVGDRVRVRDDDEEPWKKGSITEFVNGNPEVQTDDDSFDVMLNHIQPLVIAEILSFSFSF